MKFLDVLNIGKKEIISLLGAGGKTTTMYALGKEAEQKGFKTILTTTTKIYYPQDSNLKIIVTDKPEELSQNVNKAFEEHDTIIVGKSLEMGQDLNLPAKILGLDSDLFKALRDTEADLIITEADGAERKPFKAPGPHEPVTPEGSTIVMPIVGIDSIGCPLSSEYVHRPEIVAKLAAIKIGDEVTTEVTPEVVAAVITSPLGYWKDLPLGVRWIPFINKVETIKDLAIAREIAYKIRQKVPVEVFIGAALKGESIKEVVKN